MFLFNCSFLSRKLIGGDSRKSESSDGLEQIITLLDLDLNEFFVDQWSCFKTHHFNIWGQFFQIMHELFRYLREYNW